MRILLVTTIMSAALGCAKSAGIEESPKAPASKYTQTDEERANNQWIACGQTPGLGSANKLDPNRLMVTGTSGQSGNLCQVLSVSGKDVAIFQFAGLLCGSCQDEAKWVNTKPMNGFSHNLIFTDSREEITGQDFEYFKGIAPSSKYYHDYERILANELNPGKAFGTVLVLHKSGEYRLHLSPGLEQLWYADANELVRKYQSSGLNGNGSDVQIQNPPQRMQPNTQNQARPNWNYGFTY